jgi:hypothetical protein
MAAVQQKLAKTLKVAQQSLRERSGKCATFKVGHARRLRASAFCANPIC